MAIQNTNPLTAGTALAPVRSVAGQSARPADLPKGKVRLVGIHGARGTGKTCYLACLYGQRATEAASLTFADDRTIDHLQRTWKFLEQGDVPAATALALPTDLQMSLHASGLGWSLRTRDYAGALVQRTETGLPELKEEVKD